MALILDVYLNAVLVGQITQLPGERSIFSLVEGYEQDPARPTLSLSLKSADGRLAHKPTPTQMRLHPFFSNLLPEGRLRQYIADKAKVHVDRELFLLQMVGDDLPGAVIIRPQGHPPLPEDLATGHGADEPSDEGPIKFSLAGVQMKFSAVKNAKGGLTIPASGRGGSWIVKLPSEHFAAVPENEAAMMRVAEAAGFDMPAFELLPISDISGLPEGMRQDLRAYVVRRFDRDGDHRIHIEDFAQVFGVYPGDKYGKISYRDIAAVVWRETGEKGLREFIGRLVFNAAIGNGDMHAKNWSLIYRDGRTPELAPGYDFLSTLTYVSTTETMALGLVGTKSFTEVDEARFIRLAEKAGLPPGIVRSAAMEAAQRTAAAWADLKDHLDVPKFIVDAVDHNMRSVPIMAEAAKPRVRAVKKRKAPQP